MAQISAASLADAARALMLAGRWAQALTLLDASAPADAGEQSLLAVTAAEVAVEQDFFGITDVAPRYLSAASSCVSGGQLWDLDFVRLKRAYNEELTSGPASFDPADRDPAAVSALASTAASLAEEAPDAVRRAWASFYAGLIEDLLRGDTGAAAPRYTAALGTGDDLIESYALRHLGYLSFRAGDKDAARSAFRRSLSLRQRYGCVPHVLAQLLALAELDDGAGARAVAAVVRDWAGAGQGTRWLAPSAEELLTA